MFLGGSEKLLRVCLNLPYFLRYINRFQDAVSANSFFIMPATVADATAVRNGYAFLIWIQDEQRPKNWKLTFKPSPQVPFTGDRRDHGAGHALAAGAGAADAREAAGHDCAGPQLSLCWWD